MENDIIFDGNSEFDDEKEIVVRKSDFTSDRTFGLMADKACSDLKKELIEKLSNPDQKITVLIINI